MTYKIVTDSSSDLLEMEGLPFGVAPLRILTAEREYVDDARLDVEEMVRDLASYRGRSSTSCPNAEDWLHAFGDADRVFCITITSGLSGSYDAACTAKRIYEEEHPGRQVFVLDSLSAGPEMALVAESVRDQLLAGDGFEAVCRQVDMRRTGLFFVLSSLKNLANNGRVNPLVAAVAGKLGIRMVGTASEEGTLELLHKCRGESRALEAVERCMVERGYAGGRVKISHCLNESAALSLRDTILRRFPEAVVDVYPARGLCSFYAEQAGLLVGFEM